MKYLMIIAIALVVYWYWRQGRLADKAAQPPGSAPPQKAQIAAAQDMVECAVCGLHLPRSDALADGLGGTAPFFCSPEHRLARRP
jgi:uncharacterized protein